ncbi:MAG: RluA family pseudouridine synthase [Clostridiales bacterium]|nr:RluA family pseudouridine synthase [Clostridiales bacterium]
MRRAEIPERERIAAEQAYPAEPGQRLAFVVEPQGEGQRMDLYLSAMLPALSRSRIQELIKNSQILLNGQNVKSGRKLEEGDRLDCTIPAPVHLRIEPYPMDLSIVYEDPFLLVVNKPQGLVVHPAPGSGDRTLVHGLLAHCQDLSGINGVLRPGIVHRLDKDTSGLLVVAKNDESHRFLAKQIQDGTMERLYIAVVRGVISEPAGRIEAPIGRDPKDRQKMAAVAGGKEASTSYTVLDRLADKTVLQCKLHTGRTHQIRVHMKLLGYPVLGDPKYGLRKDDSPWQRQVLHAWQLSLNHPESKERMRFFAPPPEAFCKLLKEEGAVNTLAVLRREGCCEI